MIQFDSYFSDGLKPPTIVKIGDFIFCPHPLSSRNRRKESGLGMKTPRDVEPYLLPIDVCFLLLGMIWGPKLTPSSGMT